MPSLWTLQVALSGGMDAFAYRGHFRARKEAEAARARFAAAPQVIWEYNPI